MIGAVSFTTAFPVWHQGRATHAHFEVRGTASGSSYEFTSQLLVTPSAAGGGYAATLDVGLRV